MAKGLIGAAGYKAYLGALKLKKGYIGATRVYSAGNIVTYHLDSGAVYQEEVDEGETCLSPKSFTPAKSGWEFVGWRSDTTLNPDCYTSYIMGDNPVTLYAVFCQAVTVTYYDNSKTAKTASGYRYYNNGAVQDPSFTLSQEGISGWTARGWSTDNGANGGIIYGNGATFTRDSSITLYGMYQQTVTVTYYNGSTTASGTSGVRYYCPGSGKVINPSFALSQAAISDWTARGWSTGTGATAGITYGNGATFTRDTNVTLYGMYYQTVTLTIYNGSASATSQSGTRYYCPGSGSVVNPTFTVSPAALSGWSFNGWCTSAGATAGIAYSSISGMAFSASATLYGRYSKIVTLSYNGNGATGGYVAPQSGTCYYNSSGAIAGAAFSTAANGYSLPVYNFIAWALGSASGTQYVAGAGVTITGDTVMYAVWRKMTEFYVIKKGQLLDTAAQPQYTPGGSSVKTTMGYRTKWAGTGYESGVYGVLNTDNANIRSNKQYVLNIRTETKGYSKFEVSMYNDNSSGLGSLTYRVDNINNADKISNLVASGTVEAQLGDPSKKVVICGNMAGKDIITFEMILNLYAWIQSSCYLDFGFVDIRFYD